ncbi:hypothetical protein ACN28S_62435 [Cystobacter fuscus]
MSAAHEERRSPVIVVGEFLPARHQPHAGLKSIYNSNEKIHRASEKAVSHSDKLVAVGSPLLGKHAEPGGLLTQNPDGHGAIARYGHLNKAGDDADKSGGHNLNDIDQYPCDADDSKRVSSQHQEDLDEGLFGGF